MEGFAHSDVATTRLRNNSKLGLLNTNLAIFKCLVN